MKTVGELELIEFLREHSVARTGYLIDTRTSDWYLGGTIPGAVDFAFNLFEDLDTNPFAQPILTLLGGAQGTDGNWNFEQAKDLMLFCNGPWCGQSYNASQNLLKVGYAAEKLYYYRGGMQSWVSMGLTVSVTGPS